MNQLSAREKLTRKMKVIAEECYHTVFSKSSFFTTLCKSNFFVS